MAVAEVVAPAKANEPPARVRALFRKLDIDSDGRLTLDELKAGLTGDLGEDMPEHAKAAITELFEKHAKPDEKNGKSLKSGAFARFYADILFRRFDANNDGTLQLDEAQEALRFLKKKDSSGTRPAVSIAFPAEAVDKETGAVNLPFSWFWAAYLAMD